MENKNIFLDTNVIIDFLDNKRVKHKLALKLLEKLIIEDYEIFISEDMLSTIYYLIKDKERVVNFYKDISSEWNIVPFGDNVIAKAIELSLESKKDFEDILQCLLAKKYNATFIVTNDKKFTNCGVNIVDYSYFIKID